MLYVVPVVVLGIFVVLMVGGGYFKQPRGETDDVQKYIDLVKGDVTDGRWKEAEADIEKLKAAWKEVVPRIQFSVERDIIMDISLNLARLRGAIEAEDKPGALMELSEVHQLWQALGS